MKKLKNSVKAIIISCVAVVCVLAIVLGCVFGIKDNKDKEPNPNGSTPGHQAYAFTEAQKSLASELNKNVQEKKTTYEVLSDVPFTCAADKIQSVGENYYTYAKDSNSVDLVLYKKEAEDFEYKNLLELFPFDAGKTHIVANNSGYALMVNINFGKITYRVIYIADFETPVKILDIQQQEGHTFSLETFTFNDNYFGFADLYDYVDSVSDAWFNAYMYPLRTTPYEAEELQDEKYEIKEATQVHSNSYFADDYIAVINENGVNVLSYKDGNVYKKTIAYDNPYGKNMELLSLNQNKILVSVGEKLSSYSTDNDFVYDYDGSNQRVKYKYSYDVITVDGENITKTSLALNGYSKIFSYDGDTLNLSDSYAIYRQKADEQHNLTAEYNCSYYDKDDKLIIEYDTENDQERILYGGSKTFLTNDRLISSKNSTKTENICEFVDDIVEGKYELYSTFFKSKIFPIRINGGQYGLMDIDGNLVLDPTEFSFRPLLITDNYAIGYHEEVIEPEEDGGETQTLTTYYRFDFATKVRTKINLEDGEDFVELLDNGFDGYFEKDKDTEKYTLKSSSGSEIIGKEIEEVSFYSLSEGGALVKADDKYIVLNSGNSFSFSAISSGTDGGVNASAIYSEGVSSFASVQPYYSDDVSTGKHFYDTSNTYTDDSGGHCQYYYFAPSSQGMYYTKATIKWKWSQVYTCNMESIENQKKYKYKTETYWTHAMSHYYSDSMSYIYNESGYTGYIFAHIAIDSDDNNGLKIQSISDYETERAKFKFVLDANGGSNNSVSAIYAWYYYGFSTSSSEYKSASTSHITASRTGYTFNGYSSYINSSGNLTCITSDFSYSASYGPSDTRSTWYASWTAHKYNVTFSTSGGTLYTSNKSNVSYGTSFYVSDPVWLGHTFTGWSISGMSTSGKLYGTSSADTTFRSGYSSGTASVGYRYFSQLNYNDGATVTFSAQWTTNQYNVSVEYYSGYSGNNDFVATYGTSFTLSTTVTRTGYTFTGWKLENLGTDSGLTKYYGNSASSRYTIATSTTSINIGIYPYFLNLRATADLSNEEHTVKITGTWSANKYKTTFVYGNGNASKTSIQSYGSIFNESIPTRIGYDFAGWYITGMSTGHTKTYGDNYNGALLGVDLLFAQGGVTIASGTTSATTKNTTQYFKSLNSGQNSTSPTVTVTLTAQWTPHTYNISYDLKGGSEGSTLPTSARFDQSVYLPSPSKTGYIFNGWDVSGMTSGHYKYYGTTSGVPNSWSLSTPGAYGFTFTYVKSLNCNEGGTVTLTARWTPITYRISYVLGENGQNGSSAPTTATYDTSFVVSNPTRRGYTFTGWTVSGMNSGITHTLGSNTTTATSYTTNTSATSFKNLTSVSNATVTFTALWNPITYYISYAWNSGTSGTNAPTSAKYDQTVTISHPTRVGYTFVGWSITGMDTTPHIIGSTTTSVSSISGVKDTSFKNLTSRQSYTVTFNAVWQPIQYKISYNFDGGAAGSGTFPTTATYDQAFYVDNPGINRLGYHFVGWGIVNATDAAIKYYGVTSSTSTSVAKATTSFTASLNADLYSGMYFKNLQSSTVVVVTLTAKWEPNVYNIEYDLSDPKGRAGTFGSQYVTRSIEYDASFIVPNPTITGYTFIGWSLKGLSDNCTHYYGSTSFSSSNGSYVNPANPSELMVLNSSTNQFRNLHCERDATVQLIANWRANQYTITYHFLPSTLDTSTLNISTLNRASNMTATRTVTVTYDQYFMLLKATNTSSDTTGIELPADVRLRYWAFYSSAISDSSKNLASVADEPVPVDRPYFTQGTEQCYCADNAGGGFWGANCHAYAVYSFVEIEIQYYGTRVSDDINDISKYSYSGQKANVKTYSPVTLPVTLNGFKVTGYMISANRIDAGLLSNGSITSMVVSGTTYMAYAGVEVYWGYSSKLAYDLDNPVFYMYAIYEVDTYTVSFSANIPSASTYEPSGEISTITISSGSTAALPLARDVSLSLIGYTLSSYTLTDLNSKTYTLTPGQTFNPASYNIYKDIVLKVNFTPNTYTIQYELNGGTKVSGRTYPESATFDTWVKVSAPTRVGYTLSRWYVTDCTTIQTRYYGSSTTSPWTSTNNNNTLSITGTVTADFYYKNLNCDNAGVVRFCAVWTPIKYTVNISLGDGTTRSVSATYDEWFEIPYIQRPGYAFSSIKFSSQTSTCTHEYKLDDRITTSTSTSASYSSYFTQAKNMTDVNNSSVYIYIYWNGVSASSYTVRYNAGDGSPVQTFTADVDEWLELEVPVRSGYIFSGKFTIANLDASTHDIGGMFGLIAARDGEPEDITLLRYYSIDSSGSYEAFLGNIVAYVDEDPYPVTIHDFKNIICVRNLNLRGG